MAKRALATFWLIVLAPGELVAAEAQPRHLRRPACVPAWWNEDVLVAALRIELRELGLALTDSGGAIVVAVTDCAAPDGPMRIEVELAEGRWLVHELVVSDISPDLRPRAVALAVASVLRDTLVTSEPTSPAAATPPVLQSPAVEAPTAPASPPPSPSPSQRLLVHMKMVALPSGTFFGGLNMRAAYRPWEHLVWLDVGASALGTTISDPLGEIRALWVEPAVGVSAEADLGALQLGARLAVGIGWIGVEGLSSAGARSGRFGAATVAIGLGTTGRIEIARGLAMTLGVGASGLPAGLEVKADNRVRLSLRQAILVGELGLLLER